MIISANPTPAEATAYVARLLAEEAIALGVQALQDRDRDASIMTFGAWVFGLAADVLDAPASDERVSALCAAYLPDSDDLAADRAEFDTAVRLALQEAALYHHTDGCDTDSAFAAFVEDLVDYRFIRCRDAS